MLRKAYFCMCILCLCCFCTVLLLVFCHFCLSDLTDSSSFQRARFWVKELQNCEEVTKHSVTWSWMFGKFGNLIRHLMPAGTFGVYGLFLSLHANKMADNKALCYMLNLLLCLCLCHVVKHCKIYLCGTKNDLVEGDRSLRQIDYHDAQDFAEGFYLLLQISLSLTGHTGVLI